MTPSTEQLHIAPREITENEPETRAGNWLTHVPDVSSDPTPEHRMRIVEVSGVLDFWDQADEDIYSLEDGEPV